MSPERPRRIIREVPASFAITEVSSVLANRLCAAVGDDKATHDIDTDPLAEYSDIDLVARLSSMPFGTQWPEINKVMSDIDRISHAFENAKNADLELLKISGKLINVVTHIHAVSARG